MIIDCISDLHGSYPKLEGGDLLIVAGDLTARDTFQEYCLFAQWLKKQDYREKIIIAGNHDGSIQNGDLPDDILYEFIYLQDSGTEFVYFEQVPEFSNDPFNPSATVAKKLQIWGSPWTPEFCDWHFMAPPEKRKEIFAAIPNDIDILVTHGPPFRILDNVESEWGQSNESVGCKHLLNTLERIKPKLHVFGHIHEGYGQMLYKHWDASKGYTTCVNASHMDEHYNPVNPPIRVIL